MKINDIYNNSGILSNPQTFTGTADTLRVSGTTQNTSDNLPGAARGDIIEGIVSDISRDTTRISFKNSSFQNGQKDVTFSKDSINKAFVGQKRAFEVIENTPEKLVLRDLGGIAGEIDARSIQCTNVDNSLVTMANDFAETNGGIEKEDEGPIKRLTDEDYSALKEEGFSIEDFKAERLTKAIERVKSGRAAKKENIEQQSEELKKSSEDARKRAAAAVSAKYSAYSNVIDRLYEADIPITDANIAAVVSAVQMSESAADLTDNSFAYLIGNELTPSIKNIYTSVYSGVVKKVPMDENAWDQLKEQAAIIVDEANAALKAETEGDVAPDKISLEDARWMIEYDIPLNSGNLEYKKELEGLKNKKPEADRTAGLAAGALAEGKEAADAILIPVFDKNTPAKGRSVTEMTATLRLQETRLLMTTDLSAVSRLEEEISGLKDDIRKSFEMLADEIGAAPIDAGPAADTASVLENISNAPLDIYRATFSLRATVTLKELGDTGEKLITASINTTQVVTVKALKSYESSETEIRRDLGDSIQKAFRNADALLEQAGMDVNEANLRAVRILGYNSMEINADSIREMKYYDTKLTNMIEGMKPSVVLSMIRDGFNPLDHSIDEINEEILNIRDREGYSPEEKFSRFLVDLEANNGINDTEREAYIGIYRLLYQIGKDDNAAVGSAIASGRELTLKNLLTEARSRHTGVDEKIDDENEGLRSDYTNSISGQIMSGFAGYGQQTGGNSANDTDSGENPPQGDAPKENPVQASYVLTADEQEELDYNTELAREAADVTSSEAWADVLTEDYENFTLEQVTLRLKNADKQYDGSAGYAEAVRTVMMASAGSRSFLKSLGIKDSKNNLEAFEDDPSLKIASKDELLDSLTDFDDMQKLFSDRTAGKIAESELEFLGGIAILSRGRQIEQQLHSYRLLSDMAGCEHYRMSVGRDDETPARVNLTVIHGTENAGTVNISVSASSYNLQADLSMTIYSPADRPAKGKADTFAEGSVDGKILVSGEIPESVRENMIRFVSELNTLGYDTDGVVLERGTVSTERYMGTISRMEATSQRSQDSPSGRRNASTSQLYSVAKVFLANFI